MTGSKISVAMCTYNGEKYLQEQLDSLSEQRYLPHELVIGDDGSTDSTIEILERFAEKAPFPVQITINRRNLGFGENFLQTATRCTGDWVAFCDQDDLWLPNKLDLCSREIESNRELNLILQNAQICDDSLKRNGRFFPNMIKPGRYGAMSQFGFWVWPGFLQTVRASLIREHDYDIRPPNHLPGCGRQSHDKWTCMIANGLGGISVLPEVVALYRRHEQALTGDYARQSIHQRLAKARSTGNQHYRFFSGVAQESASALSTIATRTQNLGWRLGLKEEARGFLELARIQSDRANLYEFERISGRLKAYASIWARGGYVGPAFCALGWRSSIKDAFFTIFGGSKLKLTPK